MPLAALLALPTSSAPPSFRRDVACDGRRIVGLDGKALLVWDARDGRLLRRIEGDRAFASVAISPDGRRALTYGRETNEGTGTALGSRVPEAWDLRAGRPLARSPIKARDAAFAPDGRVLLAGGGRASMWDPGTGRLAALPVVADAEAEFSRDGSRALFLAYGTYSVVDTRTGEVVGRHARASGRPRLSPDGREVLMPYGPLDAGLGGRVSPTQVWAASATVTGDLPDPAPLRTLPGGQEDLAWTPDGRSVVATFEAGTARVWDAATGAERRRVTLPGRVVDSTLAPDGRRILARWAGETPEARGVALVDLNNGRELARWPDDAWNGFVGFAPDGRTLLGFATHAWGSGRHDATVWDARTGKARARFRLRSGVDRWDDPSLR